MKIQCDVCDKDEASFFCVADEAALCAACDHRVHHANKLAGKHQRFSLHHPTPKQAPLCDICQERRAFLFCQQDRAILCRECDIPIHNANEHTQKHTRYLLTGLRLSATSALYSDSQSSAESVISCLKNTKSQEPKSVHVSPTNTPSTSKSRAAAQSGGVAAPESCDKSNPQSMNGGSLMNTSVSSSSISEYLMEMLPGWHVEDFLDSSLPSAYGFCKNGEVDDLLPFWDADLGSNMSGFPTQKVGIWVPQVSPPPPPLPLNHAQNQSHQSIELAFGAPNGAKEQYKGFTNNNIKSTRKWSEDSSFVVPQISPPSKRLRTLW
ncbi:B-box zinc finger protein 21 [Sesamum alatum]|uniref:B-box zinc finger protein 21 n=1 Tax=Sesamum alatum TaxID=300844 RepID=A0AAE1YFH4_9LAMI|nr:B-box zinc finger protein 21 [Sesamum alatum]